MITLERAKMHLSTWLDAELKVSQGQSYSIGSRSLTRANVAEIRKQIKYWQNQVKICEVEASGRTVRRSKRYMPRDL